MKPTYTISCINETESVDDIIIMTDLYLQKHLPETITKKQHTLEVETFITWMQKNIYLLIKNEFDLINWNKEINNVWYAVITNKKREQRLIHALYIEPRRRKQWAWTTLLQHILKKFHSDEIYFRIYNQAVYDANFKIYEPLYKSRTSWIDREKLIDFAKKNWFSIDESPSRVWAFYKPIINHVDQQI